MLGAQLTDSELLVLGLVAEKPRHGYELEDVIERRAMRAWTQIGFSSIYFVLGKLERAKLVSARRAAGAGTKARRTYAITSSGLRTLARQTATALATVRPTYSSVLLGMVNWSVLPRSDALAALDTRREAIAAEVARIGVIQVDQQPLPDHVDALFDHVIGQLTAEAEWVTRTLEYMSTKPWLE